MKTMQQIEQEIEDAIKRLGTLLVEIMAVTPDQHPTMSDEEYKSMLFSLASVATLKDAVAGATLALKILKIMDDDRYRRLTAEIIATTKTLPS